MLDVVATALDGLDVVFVGGACLPLFVGAPDARVSG
jgi:hypothetical protein